MNRFNNISFVVFSITIAFFLNFYAFPFNLSLFKPNFLLLILIYWALTSDFLEVGLAWSVGLINDMLNNMPWGHTALAYTLVIYFVVKSKRKIRLYPLLHQSFIILALSLIYLMVTYWVQSLFQLPSTTTWPWYSAFVNAMLWWCLFPFFRKIERSTL